MFSVSSVIKGGQSEADYFALGGPFCQHVAHKKFYPGGVVPLKGP